MVTIGKGDGSKQFLSGKQNSYGLYEIHCKGERNVDPIYHKSNGMTSPSDLGCLEFGMNATPKEVLEARKLWHDRLGHTNDRVIQKLNKMKLKTGVEFDSKPETVKCEDTSSQR